jgi:hypothetical protein
MELLRSRRCRSYRTRSDLLMLLTTLASIFCNSIFRYRSFTVLSCCDACTITPAGGSLFSGGYSSPRNRVAEVYRYFGYGSNVLPSTMRALRGIDVVEATAAVLPDYELRFYGMGGNGGSGRTRHQLLVEASAAFVEPSSSSSSPPPTSSSSSHSSRHHRRSAVHGVLYTLTADDFAKVGRTEGVPWGYRWQKCRVYPYDGDGDRAGEKQEELAGAAQGAVDAYTLVAPPSLMQRGLHVPPSASYLGLIQEGARLWKFDQSYQTHLANIEVASNLLIRDGIAELALRLAERATGTERTYMIRRTTTDSKK